MCGAFAWRSITLPVYWIILWGFPITDEGAPSEGELLQYISCHRLTREGGAKLPIRSEGEEWNSFIEWKPLPCMKEISLFILRLYLRKKYVKVTTDDWKLLLWHYEINYFRTTFSNYKKVLDILAKIKLLRYLSWSLQKGRNYIKIISKSLATIPPPPS